MCSKLPAGYRLHETQCQLVHMELNRHPRGHNRIEYEQISDEEIKFIFKCIQFNDNLYEK